MIYPIVETETNDGLVLHGLLIEAQNSESVFLFIHGTASNFYENYFINVLSDELNKSNISVLSTNNRGNEVLKAYPSGGASVEKFEDCVRDIDAWVKFAINKGFKNIILAGHSLGSEKVVYYLNKGKYKARINSVVLLGFADSFGTQLKYTNGKTAMMQEARMLVKKNKGNVFIESDWNSHAGVLPKTASSYINFFSEGSELSKALPLRNGKSLEMYNKITVPILAVIGDIEKGKGHEYTVIPIKDSIKLLEKENSNAECRQIRNCNHDFEEKENELAKIIVKFLGK